MAPPPSRPPVPTPTDAEVLARVGAVVRRQRPAADLSGLRRLEGGVSSLTYAAWIDEGEAGGEPVVVKVAPAGLAPVRNRDVLRQARVLDALAGRAEFPVPRVLATDAGDPPDLPPLFVMQLRDGQAYEPGLDVSPHPPSAAVSAQRMRVAMRALAGLHALTPDDLGLGEEPVVAAAEELERWQRLFATIDRDIAPGRDELHARLAARVPEPLAPRLVHGDYRCANMLFTDDRLEAIIDWEIWSVGDPRCDLAWLLMHCAPAHVFHERRPDADLAAASALPTPSALLGDYAASRAAAPNPAPNPTPNPTAPDSAAPDPAAEIPDIDWFLALSFYKVAATLSALHKRNRKAADPDPMVAVGGRHLDEVLAAGHAALDAGPRG